jgi:hypothetical protein
VCTGACRLQTQEWQEVPEDVYFPYETAHCINSSSCLRYHTTSTNLFLILILTSSWSLLDHTKHHYCDTVLTAASLSTDTVGVDMYSGVQRVSSSSVQPHLSSSLPLVLSSSLEWIDSRSDFDARTKTMDRDLRSSLTKKQERVEISSRTQKHDLPATGRHCQLPSI